jgi:molybdopterin converting factor small subunit
VTSPDLHQHARERRELSSVTVHFYSYFKDLTGCAQTTEEVVAGSTIADLQQKLFARFPKLVAMKNSTLIAVGVDYQPKNYVLNAGDEVSLFPPVQGG